MSVWDERESFIRELIGKQVIQTNLTPECEVNGTESYDSWA